VTVTESALSPVVDMTTLYEQQRANVAVSPVVGGPVLGSQSDPKNQGPPAAWFQVYAVPSADGAAAITQTNDINNREKSLFIMV
jgi:hypothetical protein